MKKVTLKLSDGRCIEELIEIKNVDVEQLYLSLKDIMIRHMMDDSIERRIKINKEFESDIDNGVTTLGIDLAAECIHEGKIDTAQYPTDTKPQQPILNKSDVHTEESSEETQTGGKGFFLIAKCQECGKQKFFKTETGKKFHCECGYDTTMDEIILIKGSCPNCGNNVGSLPFKAPVATLPDMDIDGVVRCGQCRSFPDLIYNEKYKEWRTL